MTSKGIDYSNGQSNIDRETGIHYGVISANEVGETWYEDSEADYGNPICPKCGNEANSPDEFGETFADGVPEDYTNEKYETDDYVCVDCKHFFGPESAFGDEPMGYYLDNGNYKAIQNGGDSDIFVIKSPYYTLCQFCSPCAPGAGYLMDSIEDGVKAYCFGHNWFENERAPYPIYSVDTDERVWPRLTDDELLTLAEANNWETATYDNNGILVRKLTGSEDFQPVGDKPIETVLMKLSESDSE